MNEAREISCRLRDGVGWIVLDRPKALNALNHAMIAGHADALAAWAGDESVRAVVIRSAGGRAFCAGGDVVNLYRNRNRVLDYAYPYYAIEYGANVCLYRFPKPYVALLDGIAMGAGMGLAIHGSHRAVSENALLAMPETGIGLFPDVGASHFLPRCPGHVGMYLGLTGARIGAADALYTGLATHFVPAERFAPLEAALAGIGRAEDTRAAVDAVLAGFAGEAGPAPLEVRRETIDNCFGSDTVEKIVAALEADGGAWADATLAVLAAKSPTSLKIAHRQLKLGAALDFEACMAMEYRLACHCLARHDLYEGIRAAVIDKDRAPKWQPATLAEVGDDLIEAHFAPVDGGYELAID
jgi:enoyl-CoA hydratase